MMEKESVFLEVNLLKWDWGSCHQGSQPAAKQLGFRLYLGRKKALLLSILTALCFYLLRKTPKGYQYMGSHCSDNSVIVLSGLSTTILSFIESIAS
ncbi:hypothetical protein V6N12_025093 [Hibiscus sabdariffa]|uniref:Uncharacterized protein n=1 Tax=Hibiscus sabdariffa TaxID=183260 RepID=A0ABR2BM48_9ROSI